MSSPLLEKARLQAQLYAGKQLQGTAIFWADKALSLSGGEAHDLAALASLLHADGQHRRAAHALLSSPQFLSRSAGLRYLAAKSYVALQEWEEALLVLKPAGEDEEEGGKAGEEMSDSVHCPQLGDVAAASLLLQGRAHEGLGSLQEAAACFREALRADVFCSEALDWLCEHHSLGADDEKALLSELPFKKQCTADEERLLRVLYLAKLRHGKSADIRAACSKDANLRPLAGNSDVAWSAAYRLFCGRNVAACYEITSAELHRDPFHPALLRLHVLCCVEKRKTAELFALGHKLVANFPSSPLAWFAVSCYYLATGNHQSARKYLTKALSLDGNFASAHLAFGISFATEGEHDQAISAFSKAARIMKGSHVPLMHLGREYYVTGSTATAVKFMKSALAISPYDPSLLHEVGVMLAEIGSREKAEKYFTHALANIRSGDPHMTTGDWEPVYNNLGHVYRKLNKLEQSLEMHHRALSLGPRQPSTLTAIAFVHLLRGSYDTAVEFCSRSLQVRREDPFTIEVLRVASEELVSVPLTLGTGNESMESLEPENEILEWGQRSREAMQTS